MKLLNESVNSYDKLPDWHKECIDALNEEIFQPERSKREDCKCLVLERYLLNGEYAGKYFKCRCGALNIGESQ